MHGTNVKKGNHTVFSVRYELILCIQLRFTFFIFCWPCISIYLS